MSAYIKQETCINDQDALIEALKIKGYDTVEICETPKPLVAYQGDYRTADGNGHTTEVSKAMLADVIIRRKYVGGASNDIGFKKDEKGNYQAIISQFDSGRHNKAWMDDLLQNYGTIKAKKIAKKQGYTLARETKVNGKTRLEFTVRA